MDISREHSALITKLIEGFINEPGPGSNNVRQVAREKEVLPLLLDFGGMCAINSAGDILSFVWDDTEHPQVESDPRIRNVALFQGSKKYPELKGLIPQRPDDARICPDCGGTGVHPYATELNQDNIVCYCGGLGWLP